MLTHEAIQAVYAKHSDRNHLLGYVIGDCTWEDIEAYFGERKAYGLELEEIKPIRIPNGYGEHHFALVRKRDELQKQIDDLNEQIRSRK